MGSLDPESGRIVNPSGRDFGMGLREQAQLTGWPTPMANKLSPQTRDDFTPNLAAVAQLSGWPTCSSRDWKDTPGMAETETNPDGTERKRLDQLPRVAQLAPWPTPKAKDGSGTGGSIQEALKSSSGEKRESGASVSQNLKDYALLSQPTSTPISSSSPAVMEKPGALNPAFSRWLMGYPREWCQAAIRAYRKSKPRRKAAPCASKATETPLTQSSPRSSSSRHSKRLPKATSSNPMEDPMF